MFLFILFSLPSATLTAMEHRQAQPALESIKQEQQAQQAAVTSLTLRQQSATVTISHKSVTVIEWAIPHQSPTGLKRDLLTEVCLCSSLLALRFSSFLPSLCVQFVLPLFELTGKLFHFQCCSAHTITSVVSLSQLFDRSAPSC